MELNNDPEWIKRMAELEDGCEITAGEPPVIKFYLIKDKHSYAFLEKNSCDNTVYVRPYLGKCIIPGVSRLITGCHKVLMERYLENLKLHGLKSGYYNSSIPLDDLEIIEIKI